MKAAGTIKPLANAKVWISKIWRQQPLAGVAASPDPPVPGVPPPLVWPAPIAAIWPPSYADFPTGGMLEVEDRAIDGAISAKTLLADAPAGSTQIRISDVTGLAPFNVLFVDADDAGRSEILEIVAIRRSGTDTDWAILTLNGALALMHPRGRAVKALKAPGAVTAVTLNYDAAEGDQVALLDTTGLPVGVHQARMVGGVPPVRSYHRMSQYVTQSDAQGFYRLPPLTRAGKVEISALDSGSPAAGSIEHIPDFTVADNQVDLIVT